MSDSKKSEAIWAAAGKILLLLGIVGGIVTLYDWFSAPSESVHATIETGKVHVPPRYEEFRKGVASALEPSNIEHVIGEAAKSDYAAKVGEGSELEYLSMSVSDKLREQTGASTSLFELEIAGSRAGKYWDVAIENAGDVPVSDVVLRLPGASLAVVTREDAPESQDNSGPVFEIGDIRAGQKVQVVAWSGPFQSSSSGNPSLHHSGGPGDVTLVNNPTLWSVVKDNAAEAFVFIFIVFISVIIFTGISLTARLRSAIIGVKKEKP